MKERNEGGLQSPRKLETRTGKFSAIDDFDICAIRRTVHSIYSNSESVNPDLLLAKVHEDLSLTISRSSLRKLLLRNGFRFRKVDTRKILMGKVARRISKSSPFTGNA